MTEQLRTLLHDKADGMDFAVPDLDRLTADGDRRIRRRRSAVAGGVLSVALLVGAVAVLGDRGGDDGSATVAHPAPAARPVTWAKGSVIHAGDRTIDVGHEVHAFVETSVGYVVADAAGKMWSVVDGHATEVGTANAKHPRLVADPSGTRTAWVGTGLDAPGRVEPSGLQVLDQSGGRISIDGQSPAPGEVDALSGTTLYFHDDRGAVARDLVSGQERVVDPAGGRESPEGQGVVAANGDTLALRTDRGTLLGTSRDHAVLLEQAYGSIGAFSPDGGYYSNDADSPSVWDVRTGKQVALPGMDDYAFATGFDWLDDHTLVLIAERAEGDPMVLVTCEVPDGSSCHQVATLGGLDHPDYQLPVGQPIGDD